jgi:pheromone shutdown protein TraB
MRKAIGMAVLTLAFMPLAQAEKTVGDKAGEVKQEAVQAKREAGAEIREAGRDVKAVGRKVRQTFITRCGDGRHTMWGATGCIGHGGVSDPK